MVQTNTAQGLGHDTGDGSDWMRRAIERGVDQPPEGTPTDSQYTEGQTPADAAAQEPNA